MSKKKKSDNHFFYFEVENRGESHLIAVAGECKDESKFIKVEKFHEEYRLKEKGAVLNWFDITEREGHLSLNSKISVISSTAEGKKILTQIFSEIGEGAAGFEMTDAMRDMMGGFTLIRLASMMGAMGKQFTKEELLEINKKLNNIEI